MAANVKKYNPGFLTDEELVSSFCVRVPEFESIVETLHDSGANSNIHSIVIGPRGIGKTHLLLRIAAEVRRDTSLAGLFPVVFGEENYEIGSAGEFWLECLGHLAEQAPPEERDDLRLSYRDLMSVPLADDHALADRCLATLLDFADRRGQRLLLLVENLDMLFGEMTDVHTGWRLRKTLQTEPRVVLLGSATSRFADLDDPGKASTNHGNGAVGSGLTLSPRPRAIAVPPSIRNGTSDPSSAASPLSRSNESPRSHRRFRPTRAAAASELPPPSPADTGIRFSMLMLAPEATPDSRRRRSAACQARLASPSRSSIEHTTSRRSLASMLTVSASSRVCMMEAVSWYPSGLRPRTSKVRFSLALACSVITPHRPLPLGRARPSIVLPTRPD